MGHSANTCRARCRGRFAGSLRSGFGQTSPPIPADVRPAPARRRRCAPRHLVGGRDRQARRQGDPPQRLPSPTSTSSTTMSPKSPPADVHGGGSVTGPSTCPGPTGKTRGTISVTGAGALLTCRWCPTCRPSLRIPPAIWAKPPGNTHARCRYGLPSWAGPVTGVPSLNAT